MKKFILLLSILFISILVSGQKYFELTPLGFVDINNKDNSYVVIEFEGKTQKQLFDLFLSQLTIMYVSPKDVLISVPSVSIRVRGFSNSSIVFNKNIYYDLNYQIVFKFKDGKVRIDGMDLLGIDRNRGEIGAHKELSLVGKGKNSKWKKNQFIFDINGEIKRVDNKLQLETFINKIIDNIKNNIVNDEW